MTNEILFMLNRFRRSGMDQFAVHGESGEVTTFRSGRVILSTEGLAGLHGVDLENAVKSRLRADMQIAKPEVVSPRLHWSDCAVNNGPAMPVGECDCAGFVTHVGE